MYVHELASVIFTEYVPPDKFEFWSAVLPLLHTTLYGDEPPLILKSAKPSFESEQEGFVTVAVDDIADGSVIVSIDEVLQLFISETKQV